MMHRSFVCCLRESKRRRRRTSTLVSGGLKGCQIIVSREANTPWSFVFRRKGVSTTAARFYSIQDNETDDKGDSSPPSIWKQLQSPPNIITLTRMASTPLLAYWIVSENYTFALWGCVLAAVSDAMDGFLAKQFGWSTVVGTYLDPLADKILINTLGISLWYSGILPTPLIVVWATKDVILLSGTAWYVYQNHQSINFFSTSVAQKPLKVTPSTMAKVNTVLQFATLGIGIVTPMTSMTPVVLSSLCWVTGMTTVGSVFSYAGQSGLLVENMRKRK